MWRETSKSEQASYKVVSLTANTNKPHTIHQILLMLVCLHMVEIILGPEVAQEISELNYHHQPPSS
jgi:hypothetical protein